ncbi:glycosyltransferase family 4 protein [Guyparkeria halophila]|uniref:Glycosyltransferase family 4 protein n=1 Tax=Guyparkeria halophila TaxID=47960 RepID=A0ABZ0Z1S9_9GAMM|nr:glycosyltransferase family 4 protein [Guyparkeria halophila]WQH17377.1 glycosyltransferase family 4 protein [Guyparkeria halophila]
MIIHFSTVHARTDTRIRVKQVASLAGAFDERVALYVQDGKGNERDEAHGIEVMDTGLPSGGRLARMTKGAWRMYRAVRRARPSVAHFHDPELIPVGLALKFSGIKVVYDVHEDVPRQILGKHWISPWLRRPVAGLVEGVEWVAARVFDGVVTATPTISARFPSKKTVTVQNFPILGELVLPESTPFSERPLHVVYVGGITAARGAVEMVDALERVTNDQVRLQLGGTFTPVGRENEVSALPGWSRVVAHGWVDRITVAELLGNVRAGLVLFHPAPNHMDAQPNKMFEYMAAALPVIASDFPLWRKIIDGARCGLLVDPLDPQAIAEAIDWILMHPEEAEAMGRRGRKAVESTYNWERESETLINFYKQLLAK